MNCPPRADPREECRPLPLLDNLEGTNEGMGCMSHGCTKDAQRMHKGCTEDAQRMHTGCTEDAQRMHRGCTILRPAR